MLYKVSFEIDVNVDGWANAYDQTGVQAVVDILRELRMPQNWSQALPIDDGPMPVVSNLKAEIVVFPAQT